MFGFNQSSNDNTDVGDAVLPMLDTDVGDRGVTLSPTSLPLFDLTSIWKFFMYKALAG